PRWVPGSELDPVEPQQARFCTHPQEAVRGLGDRRRRARDLTVRHPPCRVAILGQSEHRIEGFGLPAREEPRDAQPSDTSGQPVPSGTPAADHGPEAYPVLPSGVAHFDLECCCPRLARPAPQTGAPARTDEPGRKERIETTHRTMKA